MAKKDNPCVSVCHFDGRTGWCMGCGCTLGEIRAWRKMAPYRRTALEADLGRRVRQMSKGTASIRKTDRRADDGR